MLVLLEATKRQRFLDLVFGLTEGWWRFEDTERRPDNPLLDERQWMALLEESGLREATAISREGQSVLVARKNAGSDDRAAETTWVVFADDEGIGEQLRGRLGGFLVRAGTRYERLRNREYQINATEPADYERLLQEVIEIGDRCDGVVHLWSVDRNGTEPGPDEMLAAQERGSRSVLHLVQALVKVKAPPRLWLVTNGPVAHA